MDEVSPAILKLDGVSLISGGLLALDNIDLEVKPHEILAIIGLNSANKMSILNCITGFYRHRKGKISLCMASTKLF